MNSFVTKPLSLKKNALVLICTLLLFGIIGSLSGKELTYDLVSYHFYNPFAYFNHRWGWDYFSPNSLQQYYNPTIDFLTYFLIKNFSPLTAECTISMIHGLNFWILFNISFLILSQQSKYYLTFFSLLIAFLGIYGPIAFSEIGSFMGDNFVSIFILGAVWCTLLSILNNFQKKYLVMSGILIGISFALKLTSGPFLIGLLITILFFPVPLARKMLLIFLVSVAIAISTMIISGHWFMFSWLHFKNPIFPLANGIFHAPNFPAVNWNDARFFPHGFLPIFFYPFYFSWNNLSTDLPFFDIRFAVVYLLFIAFGIKYFYQTFWLAKKPVLPIESIIIFSFYISSYILWECAFSNTRYLVTLEMLTPLIIYLLFDFLVSHITTRIVLVLTTFSLIAWLMVPIPHQRVAYGKDYFNVILPSSVSPKVNGLVLMLTPSFYERITNADLLTTKTQAPTSPEMLSGYLIPYFPSNWRFVGIPAIKNYYAIPNPARDLINHHAGKFYVLATQTNLSQFLDALKQLNFSQRGSCEQVKSDRFKMSHLLRETLWLCPVIKVFAAKK